MEEANFPGGLLKDEEIEGTDFVNCANLNNIRKDEDNIETIVMNDNVKIDLSQCAGKQYEQKDFSQEEHVQNIDFLQGYEKNTVDKNVDCSKYLHEDENNINVLGVTENTDKSPHIVLNATEINYSGLTLKDITGQQLKLLAFTDNSLIIQRIGNLNNCLLCQKCNVGPVDEHFDSNLHKSIVDKLDRFRILSIFHEFWLSIDENCRLNRNYFIPCGMKNVRCVVCLRFVKYVNISAHLSDGLCILSNHHLTEKAVETMNEMVTKMDYPSDINMTFYPNELMRRVCAVDNLSINTIQRQLENTHCLLCQRVLPGVVSKSQVMEHVSSPKHKGMLQNSENIEALVVYHNFWKSQRTIIMQIKQMYFLPLNKHEATCRKCGDAFPWEEIIYHLGIKCADSNHTDTQLKYATHTEDRVTSDDVVVKPELQEKKECNGMEGSGSYCNKTLTQLFKTYLNSRNVRQFTYCIQNRSKNEIYCLLCKKQVIEKVSNHVQSSKHLKLCLNTDMVQTLAQYHKFWMAQPENNQLLQVRFNPDEFDFMICVSCNNRIPMNQIMDHHCLTLKNKYHNYQVPEEYCDFNVKYNDEVFRKYTSIQFRETDEKILNTKIPLCMHFSNLAYCLLCGKKVFRCPKLWYKHLLDHCTDMEGVVTALPFVVQYHDFWQLQPPYNQIYMIHYVPDYKGELKCVKGHEVSYNDVIEHVNQCHIEKLGAIKRSLKNVMPKSSVKTTAIFYNNSFVNPEDCNNSETISDGNSSETDSCTDESKRIGDIENPMATDDSLLNKLKKMDINTSNKSYTECENNELLGNDEADDIIPQPLEYDTETINVVYPNYNNMNGSRRAKIYFMQKRSNKERYCLICDARIIGIPVDHARGKRHLANFENQSRKTLLASYHKFWMSLSPEKQLLQVFFNPYTHSAFKCDICKKIIRYEQAVSHPCPQIISTYEAHEVPEEYKYFKLEYNKVINNKFMSRIYTEVTKSILNTDIPLMVKFAGRVTCLLCSKRFFQETGLWHKHLLSHCGNLNNVLKLLPCVLEYHQFWVKQEPELQICMIHFSPAFKGKMRCANKHIITYNQVPEHLSNCKIPDWKKLLRILDVGEDYEGAEQNQSRTEKSDPPSVNNSNISDNEEDSDIADDESDGGIIFSESAENGVNSKESTPKLKQTIKQPKANKDVSEKKVHNVIPSIENASSSNNLDLIPHRHRPQLEHFNINSDSIDCKVCEMAFENNPLSIINHIVRSNHCKKMEKLSKRKYICDMCNRMFNNERTWATHLTSENHQQQTEKRATSSQCVIQEYECLTCDAVLYSDEKQIKVHSSKRIKKKPVVVLRPQVLQLFKDKNSTQQEAIMLHEKIQTNEKTDTQLVNDCLRGFENALRKTFPECKAYPFGSRVTGIGASNSDLDVFIDVGNMYFDNAGQMIQQELVLKVKKILKENRTSFSDILAITNARTPIIRVVHTITQIDCDLSFRHGLSVENTRFIKFCFDIQPVARLAMLILKKWADIVSLKDEITSYALCMMFIFFMQTKGYLLSICKLRKLTTEDVPTIDDWKIIKLSPSSTNDLKSHVTMYEGTVYELLLDFFLMYSKFDFTTEVVCPLLGNTIHVKQFSNNGKTLPPEMETFVAKSKANLNCKFKVSAMCIQDPFDLAHNLTKAIFPSYREKFATLCSLTSEHMKSNS